MKKKVLGMIALIILIITLLLLNINESKATILASNSEKKSNSLTILEESPLDAFESKTIKSKYNADNIETGFTYNDGMFLENAGSLSTDIAKISVALAASAYRSYQVTEILADMGFMTQTFVNYTDYKTTPKGVRATTLDYDRVTTIDDNDFVAFSISNKKITYKGEDYSIYIVPIRGTPETEEWFSDFKLSKDNESSNSNGNHYGFYTAAEQVENALYGRLKNSNQCDAEHTIVLTTGHSRGAAVANIVAGKLSTDSKYSQYVNKKHIFGYTFACPSVSKNADTTLTNIYNYNNPGDLIPELPKNEWGYQRYGITKKLDLENEFDKEIWDNVGERFFNSFEKNFNALDSTKQLVKIISDLIVNEEDFYSVDNQAFIKILCYTLAKNKTTTLDEFIGYLSKNGLGAKTATVLAEGFLDVLTEGTYSEVKNGIENIENLQKKINQFSVFIENGLEETLNYTEDEFQEWLVYNQDTINQIESQYKLNIDSRDDLVLVMSVSNEKEATCLQAVQVVSSFKELGLKLSEVKDAIFDGHTPETYVLWINSMYFGYEGWMENCLVQISLSSKVTSIGDRCFYNCKNLQRVFSGDIIRYVGDDAFNGLNNLEFFDGINPNLIYIGNRAFSDCSNLILNSEVGTKAKYIGEYAFRDCHGIKGTLVISNKIETIGIDAFSGCSGLTGNLKLGGKLKNISNGTFENCIGLTGLEIEENITKIGNFAFKGCTGLKKIKIPISTEYFGGDLYYGYADSSFYGCIGVEELEFTKGTGEIFKVSDVDYGERTVISSAKEKLKKVIFEDGIKEIYDGAFYDCKNLQIVKLPEGLEKIGDYAFYNCKNWNENVELPNTLKNIGNYAFDSCINLNTVELPKSLEKIGNYAFYECTNWKDELKLPDTLKEIGGYAFSGCTNLNVDYNLENTTHEHYEFDGWYLNQEFTNKFTENQTNQTSTIYAHWIHIHTYKEEIISEATLKTNGSIAKKCKICGEIVDKEKIYYPETISLAETKYIYIGNAIKPSVTVKGSDGKLIASSNYTLTYANNLNVGTASVTITFKGKYSGSIVKNFRITPKNISKATIKGISDKTYVAKALTQAIVVKNGNIVLKKGTDYTVSYKNNINIGIATVIVTGKGNYEGTVTKKYKINPKGTSLKKLTARSKQIKITWNKQTTETTGYEIQYSTNKNFKSSKTSKVKKNKITSSTINKLKAKKKYYVRIRAYKIANGKKYYSDWSKPKNITTKK